MSISTDAKNRKLTAGLVAVLIVCVALLAALGLARQLVWNGDAIDGVEIYQESAR